MQQNLTFQNISSEDDSSLQNDVAGKQGKNNDVERYQSICNVISTDERI